MIHVIATMFVLSSICFHAAEGSSLKRRMRRNGEEFFHLTVDDDSRAMPSTTMTTGDETERHGTEAVDDLTLTATATTTEEASEKRTPVEVTIGLQDVCCKYRAPSKNLTASCKLMPTDVYLHAKIVQMVEKRINLIEYHLTFANYTDDPLLMRNTHYHKPHVWSRASSTYGQTLLSLAFNYGIFSLMTLTFGTSSMEVELTDSPTGCFGSLSVNDKIVLIRELMMRDFDPEEFVLEGKPEEGADSKDRERHFLKGDSRICHEVIESDSGYAKFTDCCCYIGDFTMEKTCEGSSKNVPLSFLYALLSFVRYIIFFFGPLLFLSTMVGLARDEFPYTVKLNDTLVKSVFICKEDTIIPENLRYQHVLDFRHKRGFPKMKDALTVANDELMNKQDSNGSQENVNQPKSVFGSPLKIRIREYDLFINYKRLVTENDVSIGFWKTLTSMIFFCKLRNVGPFQECCKQDMLRYCNCLKGGKDSVPWLTFWRRIGLVLLVLLIPTPYYIRLLVLYYFEIDEITSRKNLIATLGLSERFENSILHYFLPDHFIFIFIYIVYGLLAIGFVAFSKQSEESRIKRIIIGSFTDLKNLSWVDVFKMMVSNIIWPFKRFGIIGCFVCLVYWPVVLPLTVVVFIFYCLPTMFITSRMLFYSKKAFHERRIKRSKRSYRVNRKVDTSLHNFDVEKILAKWCGNAYSTESLNGSGIDSLAHSKSRLMKQNSRMSDILDIDEPDHLNQSRLSKFRSISMASTVVKFDETNKVCHVLEQILVSTFCVVALYSILIIATECLGSLVDMLVFTLMGIIVNAGNLLKYIALIIMIVVYSYDSFNNVEKKYLKLNKALFTEVKSRIKDLDKVTSLPSYLQENRGFKSQEINEQAEYEMPDDVAEKLPRHWFVNDLVLFVDNEDMPRIPKKLFEDVCEIRVAGVPGPVYQGLLVALKQFLKIVTFIVFVFMVVLTFGSVYQVSNTNQMLAALAGGSLPFILRTFMEPEKPDIEMGTVSFKSKLDEVIKNFAQIWPMYDFAFELWKPEEEEGNNNDDSGEKKDSRKSSIATIPAIPKTPPPFTEAVTLPCRNMPIHYSNENIFSEYMTEETVITQEPQPNHTAVAQTRSNVSTKVCFQEPEKPLTNEVDILIYVPDEFEESFPESPDSPLGEVIVSEGSMESRA